MVSRISEASTIEPRTSGLKWRPEVAGRVEVPALTVLFHPDVRRVGERLLLTELAASRTAVLTRTEPEFATPDGIPRGPLSDPHLSRRPLRFDACGGGAIVLDPTESGTLVVVRGTKQEERCTFPRSAVDEGVVLELGGSVVLLLHRCELFSEEPQRFSLVGDSNAMVRLRGTIERVADLDVPVLLRGETGTGKELTAAAIHRASKRTGPFLAVNLGAIPDSLASSELFGAAKGAFTGAGRRQVGYFERARGGTLFLDEIGAASDEVQAMLLRVLETREIQAVGAEEPRAVDVRVITATDADLEAAVQAGTFRAALLHRLASFELHLPPLRQRRDDIGRLLVYFLRRELEAVGEAERLDSTSSLPWLPAPLVARLAQLDWPGNVRQLRNVARQLVITSRGLPQVELGPQVERLLVSEPIPDEVEGRQQIEAMVSEAPRRVDRRRVSQIPEDDLRTALMDSRWDLKAAAHALQVSRTSLYALLERHPHWRTPSQIGDEEIARCHGECVGDFETLMERLGISQRALRRRLNELGLE